MTQQLSDQWVKRSTLAWILVAQGVSILPLFTYLPLWVPVVWLFSLVWRVQIFRGAWPFPNSRIKGALGLLCVVGLGFSYAGTLGVEPLVAFLIVSFVLKLLEVRSRKDVLLIIYVGFIAVAAQFLFYQTMFIAAYGGLSVLLLICAWNCIYRSNSVPVVQQLRASMTLVLQSLPLMVLLFIVLPRVGSLWHVPIPQQTGVTGFSDTMSPGDFSSLSQSQAVAFRVTFDVNTPKQDIPSKESWYWRGLALDNFDGRNWKYDEASFLSRTSVSKGVPEFWQLQVLPGSDTFSYEVLMEPHQQRWLFSLMAPVDAISSSNKVYFAPNYLTKSVRPIAARTQYRVTSESRFLAEPDNLSTRSWRKNLRLPEGSNPRAISQARNWVKQGLTPQEIINSALKKYRDSFTYTLRPPPLGTHSVDEFLFITQRGFCEHFASSFVVLMRAAGIPARVVVGYQGGEVNPIENYIIVRQSDAHAWAEVWLQDQGWVRVDPTAAVSPLRIERGLEESLQGEDRKLMGSWFGGALFSRIQLRLDAMSYSWHQWVLGYDNDRQAGLFQSLFGGSEAWRIGGIFVAVISGFLLVYFVFLTWKGVREYQYPEQALYEKFRRKMLKMGYVQLPGETPLDFAGRVSKEAPDAAPQILRVVKLYSDIAYSNQPQLLNQLKDAVRLL